jgi:hypothetical protein
MRTTPASKVLVIVTVVLATANILSVNHRPQTDIIMYDENHVNLDLLHENGVHAVPLNEHTFDVWLQEHEYTFVDFYAPW